MTKQEMYKEKKTFINNISKVFEARPAGSAIKTINYEVYYKPIVRDDCTYHHYIEFVIITFVGGGKSVKVVTGNSNTANFSALGSMLNGGYYEENSYYNSLIKNGYELVKLEEN